MYPLGALGGWCYGIVWKEKTPEELLTEGRAQFESGDMRHMFMTLHGLANKGNPEACYYIGIYWLKEKSDKSMAKMYLTTAAKGGQADAAKLLAEQLGVRDFLPQAPEPASAPVPKPAPQPVAKPVSQPVPKPTSSSAPVSAPQSGGVLTPEEQYAKGMKLFRAGNYEEAYHLLDQVCDIIYFASDEDENIYPAGQAALGWMCETGNGTKMDIASASLYYSNAVDNATGIPDKDGMAGIVRLAANAKQPGVSQCETALDYAKQLSTDEAKRLRPVLEQKLAEAKKRENPETKQKQPKEELEHLFSEGTAAHSTKDDTKELSLPKKAAGPGDAAAHHPENTMGCVFEGKRYPFADEKGTKVQLGKLVPGDNVYVYIDGQGTAYIVYSVHTTVPIRNRNYPINHSSYGSVDAFYDKAFKGYDINKYKLLGDKENDHRSYLI